MGIRGKSFLRGPLALIGAHSGAKLEKTSLSTGGLHVPFGNFSPGFPPHSLPPGLKTPRMLASRMLSVPLDVLLPQRGNGIVSMPLCFFDLWAFADWIWAVTPLGWHL